MISMSEGRAIRLLTILFSVGLVSASCSGNAEPISLTGPSATGVAGVAEESPRAGAQAASTQLRFSVDLTVPAYPVCPLTPPDAGVITGTGVLTLLFRATENAQGTHIGTIIRGHGTATDATGGRWVWTDADLNNELFPSGNTSSNAFSQTIRENFNVIGPNGQKIMVKGTFHVTAVNGTTVVEFETGNHEDAEVCESGFVLTPLP
jgi:hypothetical protein